MKFYDVKTRSSVEVNDNDLTRKKYIRQTKNGFTQTRYAVRAAYNGRWLTKFVSESAYKSLRAPEEN